MELIITIAIMGIITPVVYNVFTHFNKLEYSIADKIDLQDSLDNFKNNIYKDIRKAVVTKESTLVGGKWKFADSDMSYNNDYCTLKGYKPLLYMGKIDDSECYYVFDIINKEIRKIDIPFDDTTVTETKYFPDILAIDSTNIGTKWSLVASDMVSTYESRSYNISEEVILKGLTLIYDSTPTDGLNNPVTYTSFTKIGAFFQDVSNSFVVLKTNTTDNNGNFLWVIVKVTSAILTYYTHTEDNLISKNIDPSGIYGGISISQTTASSGSGSELKTYSIDVNGNLKNETKVMNIRVTTLDYGGVIN